MSGVIQINPSDRPVTAKDNLKEAKKICSVRQGVNAKVFQKWRGGFTVIRKVGELTLVYCTSPHSKPILVYVDWVKVQTVNNRLVLFNLKIGADLTFSFPVSEDNSGPVAHYSADPDFGAYIQSTSESDEEKEEGATAGNNEGAFPDLRARGEPSPALLPGYPDQPGLTRVMKRCSVT